MYEFVIIHRPSKMMKNVDTVSRYIDPFIKKYLFLAFIMLDNDVRKRAFAYNFDVFLNCSNLRHVKYEDLLPEGTTAPTVPTPLVLCRTPIRFSLSCSSIHSVPTPSSLPRLVLRPEDIPWLSFDSVIHTFDTQLVSWPGGIVNLYTGNEYIILLCCF